MNHKIYAGSQEEEQEKEVRIVGRIKKDGQEGRFRIHRDRKDDAGRCVPSAGADGSEAQGVCHRWSDLGRQGGQSSLEPVTGCVNHLAHAHICCVVH